MKPTTGWTAQLAAAGILGLAATAVAGQVLPDSVQECKKETDDRRRLECFDREVAKFPVTSAEGFGLSESQVTALQKQSSPPAPKTSYLTAKVVEIRERRYAGLVVTLDNGQTWMQNEAEGTRGIRAGDAVTIKPGLLGGYWMEGPTGWITRVHRTK